MFSSVYCHLTPVESPGGLPEEVITQNQVTLSSRVEQQNTETTDHKDWGKIKKGWYKIISFILNMFLFFLEFLSFFICLRNNVSVSPDKVYSWEALHNGICHCVLDFFYFFLPKQRWNWLPLSLFPVPGLDLFNGSISVVSVATSVDVGHIENELGAGPFTCDSLNGCTPLLVDIYFVFYVKG